MPFRANLRLRWRACSRQKQLQQFVQEQATVLQQEYQTTDPNLAVLLENLPLPAAVIPLEIFSTGCCGAVCLPERHLPHEPGYCRPGADIE